MPKYTSPALLSSFKQLCNTPYLEFTKAYENLDTHRLVELITQHRKVFEQDATAGLVNRCMRMIPSRKIIKLGNVYKTIELDEVVRNIQIVQTNPDPAAIAAGQIIFPDPEQAKNFIRQAVQALVREAVDPPFQHASSELILVIQVAERKLTAIIKPAQSPAQGEYLEFLVVRPSPVESAQALQRSLALIRNSSWSVSQLDKSISSSRDFLNKAYTLSGRGTGSGAGAGGMDHGFDASAFHPGNFAAEEDLLGDKEMRGSDIWDD